jgi:hypothetical protein
MPVDFERARKCAFTRAEPSPDGVMGGAEILIMVYANGQGVPKNFELALRFACTLGGAGAEISGRLIGPSLRAASARHTRSCCVTATSSSPSRAKCDLQPSWMTE